MTTQKNTPVLTDGILANIRKLADHWQASPQSILDAAVAMLVDEIEHDAEYIPDRLIVGNADPWHRNLGPGWRSIMDLPEFKALHERTIALEREYPEAVPYYEDGLNLTAHITKQVHELADIWECRWPQTALRNAVEITLTTVKRYKRG